MKMNGRIYGEKVSINMGQVKNFYNQRASTQADSIGSVLLGAQDPEILRQKNAFERDEIIPLLNITGNTRVLDLGCGIGRFAEFLLPKCGFYYGVDFSKEMIKTAKQRCKELSSPQGGYELRCLPLLEATSESPDFFGGKFGAVICVGVLMYINDEIVQQICSNLLNLLEPQSTIYFTEPVGIGQRLTLDAFPSEALQTSYSAIYRTPEEYIELYRPLLESGFSIIKRDYMPKFGETYTDTGRYFMILQR